MDIHTQNLLLEGRVKNIPYFTDMRSVFAALPGVCASHDWLISNLECVWLGGDDEAASPDERFATQPVLITGDDLEEMIQTKEIQFCWAVFSALPKGWKPETHNLPYADGNPAFWVGSPISRGRSRDSLLG